MPKTKSPDRGKPTPGPWRITGFIASHGFTGFPIYNGSEPNTGRNIVDVLYDPATYREDEANARLVAAAPDGLRAASMAYLHILKTPHDHIRLQGQGVLAALRDFIALATGKSAEEVQNDFEEMTLQSKGGE